MKEKSAYCFCRAAFFSLVAMCLCATPAVAQSSKKDSLIKLLSRTTNDTVKIKLLNELSQELKTTNHDSAIILSQQALALCEKTNQTFQKAVALHNLGIFSSAAAKYEDAVQFYQKAVKVWEELLKKENTPKSSRKMRARMAKTFGNMGNVYVTKSDFAKSLQYYFQALALDEQNKDTLEIARMLSGIGVVYTALKDSTAALKYFEQGLKVCELHPDKNLSGVFYGNIGLLYNSLEKNKLAIDYYKKAVAISAESGDKKSMARQYNNIANAFCDENEFKLALQYYYLAVPINEELHNTRGISTNYIGIATALFHMKDYVKSEKYFLQSLDIAQKIQIPEMLKNIHQSLSSLYSEMKKYDKALMHYKLFISQRDSIWSEDNTKKEVQIQMQYEFGKKESEARSQQEKKDLLREEDARKQKLILWFTISGLLIVLALAVIIFRSLILNKRKNKIISEQKVIVEKQKHLVEEKQKEILDSIYYARRIQRSLLTNEKYFAKQLLKLSEKNG